MKHPQSPPALGPLLAEAADGGPERLAKILANSRPVDHKGRYLHWDQLRRRTPPDGLTREQWWLGVALSRQATARPLPPVDRDGEPFRFSNVDPIQEMLHRIDQQASGQILADDLVTDPRSSDRYLISSLIEEAITSSQLEGASTTRAIGKELLKSGRAPRDRSEQMIFNNFNAMQLADLMAQGTDTLTPEDVLELHRVVTEDALDDPTDAGRIQTADEERVAVYAPETDLLLHRPPPASELPERLAQLCAFANGELGEGFVHPVVRAVTLHFWLGYDHPFVDGNGRTARALFYWSMLRSGYWLSQYISISSILRKAPAQYAMSYLYTESDENDLTYFIIYQLRVIERAIEGLKNYLTRKVREDRKLQILLHDSPAVNHRQRALLSSAIRDQHQPFTIKAHQRQHRVAYQSARTDLLGLEDLGLFVRTKIGREFVFLAVPDLPNQIGDLAHR